MGNCADNSTVAFEETYVTKPPDLDQVSREVNETVRPKATMVLSEEALLDDNTESIEVQLMQNDIQPLNKADLLRHTSEISKNAIRKLATRIDSDHEVAIVKLNLDSTNFFRELNDRGELKTFLRKVKNKVTDQCI